MIKRALGQKSFSVYDDPNDIGQSDVLRKLVGHLDQRDLSDDFLEAARSSSDLHFVKIHAAKPPDESRAIYVVRDGRAATVSYYHYEADYLTHGHSLEQLAAGDGPYGTWAEHVEQWNPWQRPRTLLLRFEDLCEVGEETIDQLAEFTGCPVIDYPEVNFAELQSADSRFFRSGSDRASIDELNSICPDLFELMNGHVLRQLGYTSTSRPLRRAALRSQISALAAGRR